MSPYTLPPGGADAIRAETFQSALHPRVLGRLGAFAGPAWRLVQIEQGDAEVIDGAETHRLIGPSVLLQPWQRDTRLRIGAGAAGVHILISANTLAGAIGHKPESPELRFMSEQRAQIALAGHPELERAMGQAIQIMLEETSRMSAAAHTVIEAALRIVMIHLWRAQDIQPATEAAVGTAASTTRRLQSQFNNLVEVHYRKRWTVEKYASALGITADRLNDICRRARGRTPRQVIASRVGLEARLLLENSLHSLDQIASDLGFTSTAQFNRFFKSIHGIPPGQFRRRRDNHAESPIEVTPPDLFQWP